MEEGRHTYDRGNQITKKKEAREEQQVSPKVRSAHHLIAEDDTAQGLQLFISTWGGEEFCVSVAEESAKQSERETGAVDSPIAPMMEEVVILSQNPFNQGTAIMKADVTPNTISMVIKTGTLIKKRTMNGGRLGGHTQAQHRRIVSQQGRSEGKG